MKRLLLLLLALPSLVSCDLVSSLSEVGDMMTGYKPRLVVLTDIGPSNVEPDDMESLARLLAYADMFEIEGIVTSTGWNTSDYPDAWTAHRDSMVEAYSIDVNNLMKRSSQSSFHDLDAEKSQPQVVGYWPSADYIRSRCIMGSRRMGIEQIGPDNDSDGSNLIISLADEEDTRPIWIATWGGANTLAQAIWRVKNDRSPEQLNRFLHKLRVYTITDQDVPWQIRHSRYDFSSHQWMRREFADDLQFIWDESAWTSQCENGVKNWADYAQHIQGHGAMGSIYPKYKWGVEGDTPSFLQLLPIGLNDPSDPRQVGWGGCFERAVAMDSLTTAWVNWTGRQKEISKSYEDQFYPDEFNDFAARMQWAAEGRGNRNPKALFNISDMNDQDINDDNLGKALMAKAFNITREPFRFVVVTEGNAQSLVVDLSLSTDPDGDELSYKFYQQKGIGNVNLGLEVDGPKATVTIPADVHSDEAHLICEVRDNGPFSLVSYRRIIFVIQ